MKLKITLATATAMGLLMGSAHAGDDNRSFITQTSGTAAGNSASITQDGNRNEAGSDRTASTFVRQVTPNSSVQGNDLMFLQRGNDNRIGSNVTHNNGFLQNGVGNDADITQNTSDNRVNYVFQQNVTNAVPSNVLTISQGDGTATAATATRNLVARVLQTKTHTGTSNIANLTQNGGTDNLIGSLNGGTSTSSEAATAGVVQNGMSHFASVTQTGTANEMILLQQDGGATNGKDNSATIIQNGTGNKIGRTYTGPTTWVGIRQISHVIDGAGNTASISQIGSFNEVLSVLQDSDFGTAQNSLSMTFNGSSSGTTAFDSDAAAVPGVTQSVVTQIGGGNSIGYSVTGDNNSFGFNQSGEGNGINGVATGNDHQVAISQVGSENTTDFLQSGTGNNAGIAIDGSSNVLDIRQEQSGASGNLMTVSITGDGNNSTLAPDLSGAADAARDLAASTLGAGDLVQSGSGNSLTVTILSSLNAFGTYQSGAGNAITHTISDGDQNQAFVAQVGNGNISVTSQLGGGNNLGVSQ